MTDPRTEAFYGLMAALIGVVGLVANLFALRDRVRASPQHDLATFYWFLLAGAIMFACVALSAAWHYYRSSRIARAALWCATLLLAPYTLLIAVGEGVGILLLPAFALSIIALVKGRRAQNQV